MTNLIKIDSFNHFWRFIWHLYGKLWFFIKISKIAQEFKFQKLTSEFNFQKLSQKFFNDNLFEIILLFI